MKYNTTDIQYNRHHVQRGHRLLHEKESREERLYNFIILTNTSYKSHYINIFKPLLYKWRPFAQLIISYSQRLNSGKPLGTGCCEWLWSIATWANPTGCSPIKPLSNHFRPLLNIYRTTIDVYQTIIEPHRTTIEHLSNVYRITSNIYWTSNHYQTSIKLL